MRAAKQNPPARREDAAESSSKLPSSSSEGFQQKWGWRWMMSLRPVQEMCWVVEGAHRRYAADERSLYTGQMLGVKFMVSLFLVHAEEGGPAP